MEQLDLEGWIVKFDAERTRLAYAASDHGAHDCSCWYCRNFIAARDSAYSTPFLELLERLGVERHKEAEVYELGPASAPKTRLYAGWYHFVGEVTVDPGTETKLAEKDETQWYVHFTQRGDLAPQSFRGLKLVQVGFRVELPWVLTEGPD